MEQILKYFPDFSAEKFALLQGYLDKLLSWNERINLISRQDTDHVTERHLLHSLSLFAAFDFSPGTKILDLGTGGGLPGIPMAVCFPECNFTLIDATRKKIQAVQEMCEALGISNVKAYHLRVEECKEKFDFVITRAVAPMKELWYWAQPLFTSNPMMATCKWPEPNPIAGGLIALKGGDLRHEINLMNHVRKGKAGKGSEPAETLLIPIAEFFSESYFEEKYIVCIPARQTENTRQA